MPLGNTSDLIRRDNLSVVLELVHRSGGVSRAALAARTGLNRSTVAALVARLVELELVAESTPEPTKKVGRPSAVVSPHPAPLVIAVNPELDAVTVALVGLSARVVHRVRHEVDHPVGPEETARIVAQVIASFTAELAGHRVVGIGLAVPGLVRAQDGLVRWAPHLGWTDAPITELVTAATGLPSSVANDASLGALAEHVFGAGRGERDIIYLNGGASGIGGGVIVGGQPLGGAGGYAGEFGQNRPGIGDPAARVTQDGTLEDEVSRARLLAALGLAGADELELRDALLASTDPRVLAEIARQRVVLSVALSNAINVFNPAVVLLGGFLSTLQASDPAALERLVAETSVAAAWSDVRILPAALGPDLLSIGAAEMAFTPLLSHPGGAQ